MTRARLILRLLPRSSLCLLGAFALLAASARAQSSVMANAPIKNIRLPAFNDQGNRTSLLRGGEARYINSTQIDIISLNFAQFAGDGSAETINLLLAPSATVFIKEKNHALLTGKQSVRLIGNDIEATGEDWSYDHDGQRLIMNKNVRVVFRTELKGILN